MSEQDRLELASIYVRDRLHYFGTTLHQLRARERDRTARSKMEEQSLIELMRPFANVLAIIEGAADEQAAEGSAGDIIDRYVELASREPWTQSKTER